MKQLTIYGLQDPRTKEFRYVGQTADVQKRYADHVAAPVVDFGRSWSKIKAEVAPKEVWVAELADAGLAPELVELSTATGRAEALSVESRYIQRLADDGHSLFNREVKGKGQRPRCAFGRVMMCIAIKKSALKYTHVAALLREKTGLRVSSTSIANYAIGRTKPKEAFNNAFIEAFELTDEEQERYWWAVQHGKDLKHKGKVFFGGEPERP